MIRYRALMLLSLLLLLPAIVPAQPTLDLRSVAVNWPSVTCSFSVTCGGTKVYNLTKKQLRLFEDGEEITNYTLSCPDPTIPCPKSVSMVFDASSVMVGTGNTVAKFGGYAFVGKMNKADEGAVLSFNSSVATRQSMTTNQALLTRAISALPATGGNRMWDGIYEAVLEVINHGNNPCRAVIAFGAGVDASSTHTTAQVIGLANKYLIPVYTLAFGKRADTTGLKAVAAQTNGRFFRVNTEPEAISAYEWIYDDIRPPGGDECIITYSAECPDGSQRVIRLQATNVCGGSDTKSKTYTAASESFKPAEFKGFLSDVYMKSGSDAIAELRLTESLGGETLHPFSFDLLYDANVAVLKGAAAPAGTLLEGVPLLLTPIPGGTRVRVEQAKKINTAGTLMHLTFTGGSSQVDTLCTPVTVSNVTFDRGCLTLVLTSGRACVISGTPIIKCMMNAPQALMWDSGIDDYVPNPFDVIGTFFNDGESPAENGKYKITYDPAVLELVSPSSDEQNGIPPDIAAAGSCQAVWQVRALPQANAVATDVCIAASFDNHPTVNCCTRVYIPATATRFVCTLDLPTLTVDTTRLRYVPMPFEVTVNVLNDGGMSDTVFAEIVPGGALMLAEPFSPPQFIKRISPPVLTPGAQGTVKWMLSHPSSPAGANPQVRVRVFEVPNLAHECVKTLAVPPMPPGPRIIVTPPGPVDLCGGDTVTLDAGPGLFTYLWSTGESSQKIEVHIPGAYWVTGTDNSGKMAQSDTVHVLAVPSPPKSQIRRTDDVLLADDAVTHQWYLNSNPITGQLKQYLQIMGPGRYQVELGNEYGCRTMSDPYVVSSTSVGPTLPSDFSMAVYPEPSSGILTVAFLADHHYEGRLFVYDMLGQLQYSSGRIDFSGSLQQQIDLGSLPNGAYVLQFRAGEGHTSRVFRILRP